MCKENVCGVRRMYVCAEENVCVRRMYVCVRRMYVCVRRMYVCVRRMYVCESARMNYGLNGPS